MALNAIIYWQEFDIVTWSADILWLPIVHLGIVFKHLDSFGLAFCSHRIHLGLISPAFEFLLDLFIVLAFLAAAHEIQKVSEHCLKV